MRAERMGQPIGTGLQPRGLNLSLTQLRQGEWFIIKPGGKEYFYVGCTQNGIYIYSDDQGRLYDRKKGNIYARIRK